VQVQGLKEGQNIKRADDMVASFDDINQTLQQLTEELNRILDQ